MGRSTITQQDLDELLTVEEAAKRLHCHKNSVWRYIRDGKITTLTLGGRRLITERHLLAYVNSQVDVTTRKAS